MTDAPEARLTITAEVPPARLEDLTRQLHRDLLQARVEAARPETRAEPGDRGDPVTIGAIALAALSGGSIAAVINCVKALIEREKTVRVVVTTPDGRRVPLDPASPALAAALGLPASTPAPPPAPPQAADGGRRRAFLVGATQFPLDETLAPLRGPANDVAALARLLGEPGRGGWEVETLVDRPAGEVLSTLDEAFSEAGPRDRVLLFYAGHGKLDSAGRLCLAAADTRPRALFSTSIPARSLRDMIEASRAASTVLLLDCCYSGAIGSDLARGDVNSQMSLLGEAQGLYILTASTRVQAAKEAETERDGTVLGRFTDAILRGIESGEADLDGDGVVTLSELNRHLARTVRGQTPQFWAREASGDPEFVRIAPRIGLAERRLERLGAWYAAGRLPDAAYFGLVAVAEGESPLAPAAAAALTRLLDQDGSTPGAVLAAWRGFQAPPSPAPVAAPAPVSPPAPPPAPPAAAAGPAMPEAAPAAPAVAIPAAANPSVGPASPWPLLVALSPALAGQVVLAGMVAASSGQRQDVLAGSVGLTLLLLALLLRDRQWPIPLLASGAPPGLGLWRRCRRLVRPVHGKLLLAAAPLLLLNLQATRQCLESYQSRDWSGRWIAQTYYRSCMNGQETPYVAAAALLAVTLFLGPWVLRLARRRRETAS